MADAEGAGMSDVSMAPCPFCGGPAKFSIDAPNDECWVACESDSCDVCPSVAASTPKEAYARWNRRELNAATNTGRKSGVPSRMTRSNTGLESDKEWEGWVRGWNACIDQMEYNLRNSHSSPEGRKSGEVERSREIFREAFAHISMYLDFSAEDDQWGYMPRNEWFGHASVQAAIEEENRLIENAHSSPDHS